MDDFLKRTFELLKLQGKKHKDLADHLGITPQRVTDWKSGRIFSYSKYMDKIADYLGVSVDYLLTGKTAAPDFPNVTPVVHRRVPLLGEIACGEPIYADEEHEYSVPLGSDQEADFVLRAKGDSMIGAHIHDGDLVFFRHCDVVDNGKIAIVVIGDEATLKRVYYTPEKQQLILMPENPAYRPLVFVGNELEQVRIMGEALFVQTMLH
ncbi:MAG: helix-turn-helix domain-containing protein [Clostridia bacterium]|nr:helix-turn-helix domain-containing protein [Clostridia bacterium]